MALKTQYFAVCLGPVPKVMTVQLQRHLEKSPQWEYTDEKHKQRLTISKNKVIFNSSFFQTEYGICHHKPGNRSSSHRLPQKATLSAFGPQKMTEQD